MSLPSQTPPVPTPPAAGSSPLVEQLPSDVTQVTVMPGFGPTVQVAIHAATGMPEPVPGAVAAVTIYGDGRIEYHPITAATGSLS